MTEATRRRRAAAGVTLAGISLITGVISYQHGLDVARWTGNTGSVAYLLPLVPDLMIVGSSLTLMEAATMRAGRPLMALLALVAGIGWTVAQNVAAGWHSSPGGAVLAGGVPLAFVATFESLLWLYRRGRDGVTPGPVPATCGHQPPLTLDAAIELAAPHMPKRQIAAAFEVSRQRVDKVLPPEPRVAAAEPSDPAGTSPRSLASRPATDPAGASLSIAPRPAQDPAGPVPASNLARPAQAALNGHADG